MAQKKNVIKQLFNAIGKSFDFAAPSMVPDIADTIIDSEMFRGIRNWDNLYWYANMGSGGARSSFTYSDVKSAKLAYECCPPFGSIVDRKAQAHINCKIWVMHKYPNGKDREDKSKWADQVRKKLQQPNPFQTGKQFLAEQKIFVETFGWCLLWVVTPAGFEKYGAVESSAMWNIAPSSIDIQETQKLWYQSKLSDIVKSIVVNINGQRQEIPLDQIYIFKSYRPNLCNPLFPESRARALAAPISNIIGAYDARGELINHAGAQGIVAPKQDPAGAIMFTPEDKEDLQRESREYGVKRGQKRYVFSPKGLEWVQIGRPTKDLLLFEEIAEDTKELCAAFGYPYSLLQPDTTFNNQNTANKSVYQDTIIPESSLFEEGWSAVFKTADNNAYIDFDYSEVPALQEDKKAFADARSVLGLALVNEFDNNLTTYNRVKELMGEDQVEWGDALKWELQRDGYLPGNTVTNDTTRVQTEAQSAQQQTGANGTQQTETNTGAASGNTASGSGQTQQQEANTGANQGN